MLDTRFLRGSDGTGNAVLARVNTIRLVGATVLKVDSVSKWPTGAFIATVGTLNATGFLDPSLAPITEFRGHITAGDIIIDSYEPGYADVGNAINQYVMLKQTTGWANLNQDATAELQLEDIIRHSRTFTDYIFSGGVWSLVSGLNGAMTALIGYQAGIPITNALIATRAFTASKDTYVDVLRGGTNIAPTATIVYTEAVNGGASPALAANSIRLAKVITSGAAITSVVQTGSDSLGNIIYPITTPLSTASLQNPSKFSVYRAAAFNYASPGRVDMDTKLFDSNNEVDIVTNKGRFTAKRAGFYFCTAGYGVNANGSGFQAYLYKNGAPAVQGSSYIQAGGSWTNQFVVSGLIYLAVGDYIEPWFYGSGSAATTGSSTCYFQGFLVSPI